MIPKGVDAADVIDELADVWEEELLEPGTLVVECALTGQLERIKVSFSLFIADAVGANPVIGMLSHNCLRGCRHCLQLTAEMWPPSAAHKNAPRRTDADMVDAYSTHIPIVAAGGRAALAAVKQLQQLGLRPRMSSFAKLFKDIYSASPYCLLHQTFLGTVKKHLFMELERMSDEDLLELDSRFLELNRLGCINKISSCQYVGRWNGEEAAAFMSVAVIVLQDLIDDDHMPAWRYHSAYVELLCRPMLEDKHLHRIDQNWLNLLLSIHRNFPEVSLASINWHAGWHWSESIKKYGVPSQFSTSRYEAQHADLKAWKPVTNNHNHLVDIGVRAHMKQVMGIYLGDHRTLTSGVSATYESKKKRRQRKTITAPNGMEFRSRSNARYCYFKTFYNVFQSHCLSL